MRWGPLALLLLAASARAETSFDDSGVRVYYEARNLWRSEAGSFLGRREGKSLVLTYDFFDSNGEARYAACPPDRGDPGRAPDCAAVQAAVGQALGL
ncbi:MAG: hypothetical protein NUW21_09225, partial [Elusimicrobia bacterium]|nr:hypothetical protein [Elusimicrobiota bacterium]